MRAKNVWLVVVGFWTLLKVTVCDPEGVAELPLLLKRKEPAVTVLTIQPDASPIPVGWLMVDEELLKPVGVVQEPEAVVQIKAANDCMVVPVVGTVKVNAYVVVALLLAGLELLNVSLRLVIWAAETLGKKTVCSDTSESTAASVKKVTLLTSK